MKLKQGKLFYKVKASYDEAALRFIAEQQAKIDEYNRAIDDILLYLVNEKQYTLQSKDDRIAMIYKEIHKIRNNH